MALDLDPFDGQDHSRDVVVYRAIVRFTVEQSSVWLNPRFTDADRRRILASPLRLNFKGTWPPTLTSDDARNLHLLAYTRLAAGMNVRNRTAPNMTAAELRELVCNRRPALDPALDQTDIEQYASYNVTVAVSERGEHVLTIRRSARAGHCPVRMRTALRCASRQFMRTFKNWSKPICWRRQLNSPHNEEARRRIGVERAGPAL
jgi:hypothetical protein